MRSVLGMYGNVALVRAFWPECGVWAVVREGHLQCCYHRYGGDPRRIKRMCESPQIRRCPSVEAAKEILDAQNNRCLYCDHEFGDAVFYKGRRRLIKLHWDHMVPWDYTQNNSDENFAAACSICNGIKSDLVFRTVEEVRLHVGVYWERYTKRSAIEVPHLLDAFPD